MFTAVVLTPAVFLLVLLALPLMHARGLLPIGLATALLACVLVVAELDVLANFAKLAAVTLLAFWFLDFFEELSWVVIVACVIPVVDAISVWRGPTRHIVEERPEVFGALSFAFPVPGEGAFQLGLPDLLFFAIFLGAAARWGLRLLATWVCLVASFGATMALAIYVDPFGIGGLPGAAAPLRRLPRPERRPDLAPDPRTSAATGSTTRNRQSDSLLLVPVSSGARAARKPDPAPAAPPSRRAACAGTCPPAAPATSS